MKFIAKAMRYLYMSGYVPVSETFIFFNTCKYGTSSLLTMNPGVSLQSTVT